jgi:hypothetical protein
MVDDLTYYTRLVTIVVAQLPDLPPDHQEEVEHFLLEPNDTDVGLTRDGDDILFRLGKVVFHIPVLWLTAPMEPGTPATN